MDRPGGRTNRGFGGRLTLFLLLLSLSGLLLLLYYVTELIASLPDPLPAS